MRRCILELTSVMSEVLTLLNIATPITTVSDLRSETFTHTHHGDTYEMLPAKNTQIFAVTSQA